MTINESLDSVGDRAIYFQDFETRWGSDAARYVSRELCICKATVRRN